MKPETFYSLQLNNKRGSTDVDVVVTLDEEFIGKFRLFANGSTQFVERCFRQMAKTKYFRSTSKKQVFQVTFSPRKESAYEETVDLGQSKAEAYLMENADHSHRFNPQRSLCAELTNGAWSSLRAIPVDQIDESKVTTLTFSVDPP